MTSYNIFFFHVSSSVKCNISACVEGSCSSLRVSKYSQVTRNYQNKTGGEIRLLLKNKRDLPFNR